MNARQMVRREHVREWGRCGRPFVTHLLNDDKDAPWCGAKFNDANKIAAHENSVSCNDCQRLAAKPVYDRNRAAKEPREKARRIPFKQGRQFETRAQVEARSG